MKKIILIFILLPITVFAQKYTISGYISDAANNENLIGANIYYHQGKSGTITNSYGFYSLTIPKGKVKITYTFVGYNSISKEFNLKSDTSININLNSNIEIKEVKVIGKKDESTLESSQISANYVPIKTINKIPALLGEVDVIKAIQLLPGVQSGTEGSSGMYVRGGGQDQNLILLDGIPVYNVNHLFGFFSVFNADAINSVNLIKGGFPARYGGRLSSVLDIRMKEGNNEKIHGNGSIGIISSKLALEGPIIKDKMSFLISGRRTYIDILAAPFIAMANKQDDGSKLRTGYFFYDLTGKINYKFSKKNRLYISAYLGNDKAYFKNKYESQTENYEDSFQLKWGNIISSLRWNWMINNKLFSNTSLSYSRYKFLTGIEEQSNNESFSFEYFSGIDDYAAKIDFDYNPNPKNYIRFGINNTYHTFNPGVNAFKMTSQIESNIDTTFGNRKIYANEIYVYLEDDITIGKLKTNIGVHASGFFVKETFYKNIEPRISMRFLITNNWSIKAAYTMMTQYIHLLANNNIGLPTDLWLPVTDSIKPQKSTQYAVGSVYKLKKGIEISLEGFYKEMDNLLSYKEGASYLSTNDDWQHKVEFGRGWAYGMELLLRKTIGKTTGWIGYTLSWSDRQFENIGFGEKFPYKYDRRHDISIVVTHKFTDKFDIGFSWIYGSGYATTLATEAYSSINGNSIEYFNKRNSFRMPSYHKLDLSFNFHKEKKWGSRTLSFGAYNAYNRKNPFFLYFGYEYDNDSQESKKVLKQMSLFPIIPFIKYQFKF